jgi:hypothetical protein
MKTHIDYFLDIMRLILRISSKNHLPPAWETLPNSTSPTEFSEWISGQILRYIIGKL